jgi:hypothetical protein
MIVLMIIFIYPLTFIYYKVLIIIFGGENVMSRVKIFFFLKKTKVMSFLLIIWSLNFMFLQI